MMQFKKFPTLQGPQVFGGQLEGWQTRIGCCSWLVSFKMQSQLAAAGLALAHQAAKQAQLPLLCNTDTETEKLQRMEKHRP